MKNFARSVWALGAVSLTFTSVGAAGADAPPVQHVRGTLTTVSPTEVTVSTAGGPVKLTIGPKTRLVGVVPATAAEITSGAFIGTANVPGSSSMSARALEVVVFPASMAGTGEGDYAWDLPAGKAHSSMTNGTVAARRGSMMTNATVTGVNNGSTKTVTLQYKGGSKKVSIEPGTPIVRIVPGSTALLTTGAHVFAVPGAAGAPAAALIVGEHGAIPPM